MVFGLGEKKENPEEPVSELPPPPGQPTLGPPTDLVIGMRNQGFTNNQIVQALQRDGYSSDQIFDAMNQADIKTGGQPIPMEAPPAMGMPSAPEEPPIAPLPKIEGSGREQVEELTEAIIDEKWTELTENIKKVVEWKTKTEAKIDAFEQKIDQMQKSFDELNKAIIGKIGEYDKHVTEIGTDVKAMEQVFQKILPTFTDNVKELSRLVKKTKKKS